MWTLLNHLLVTGGLGSPIYRILREERKLVYHAGCYHNLFVDGGVLALYAEARTEHIPAIRNAFHDVLRDKQTRSCEWFEYVKDAIRSEVDMRIVNPEDYTFMGELRLKMYYDLLSDQDLVTQLTSITHDEIVSLLNTLTPDCAHTVIFQGTGKTA